MKPEELTTRQIMNRIYKDVCGFQIPKEDEQHIRKSKGSPIYGEITHQSVVKLLNYLDLSSRDVFYDLGSGVGKVILQTALITKVKKAVGIELSKVRHENAKMALKKAIQWAPNIQNRCQFKNADLMHVNLSEASIIYTCSTAFSMAFMKKVTERLSGYTHKFLLVTLQDLPNERAFTMIDKIRLNMSWIRSTPVYIYRRN